MLRKGLLAMALVAFWIPTGVKAQSTPIIDGDRISIGVSADSYNAAKYPNGALTILYGGKTREFLTLDLHATKVIGQFTYQARGGFERSVLQSGGFDFFLFGEGGVALNDVTTGVFGGGGGIVLPTLKALRGWHPAISAEGLSNSSSVPTLAVKVELRKMF